MLESNPSPNAAQRPSTSAAVMLETAADGVYLRTASFQRLTEALDHAFASLLGRVPDLAVRGGAVMAMEDLERSAYIDRFPQLVALVTPHIASLDAGADTAMTPAACLSLYPMVAAMAPIGPNGFSVAVTAPCHRTEAAYSFTRLRSFTMSELVFFGRPEQVHTFIDELHHAVCAWLETLGLSPIKRTANDPFYGRGAEIMAQHQRNLQSKTEMLLPIGKFGEVACLSFNHHGDFFSQRWNIRLTEGGLARSACVGVGLERLAHALIEQYGADLDIWPLKVSRALFSRHD